MDAERAEDAWKAARARLDEARADEAVPLLRGYLAEFRDDWHARAELARALYYCGEDAAAREALEAIAEADRDPVVIANLGALAGEAGDLAAEAAAYAAAPGPAATPDFVFNRALAAAQRGDPAELRRCRDALREAGADPLDRAWVEALLAEQRGDAAAAAGFYEDADDGAGWEAPYAAARQWVAAGDAARAAPLVAEALQRGGGWEAGVLMGLVAAARGRPDAALEHLRRAAAAAGPDEPGAAMALARFELDRGEPGAAAAALDGRLGEGADADALLLLARARFAAGEYAGAAETFERVLAREPQHFRATYNLAFAREKLGDFEAAAASYAKALALRPGHYKSLNKLGKLKLRAGAVDEATRMAQKSLRQEGEENLPGYALLGAAMKAAKKFDEAAYAFEEAVKRAPEDPGYRVEWAACLRRLGRTAAAKEQAKTARALAPDDLEAHVELGLAYLALGGEENLRKSRKAFEGADGLRPGLPKVLAGLAQVAARLDEPAAALAAAARALEAGGGYRAHCAHGEALEAAGDPREAIQAFKRCLAIHRAYPPAAEGISRCYSLLGDASRAEKYARTAEKMREGRQVTPEDVTQLVRG